MRSLMMFQRILFASLLLTVVCGVAIGADSGNIRQTDAVSTTELPRQIQNLLAEDTDGWEFKLMPYVWVPAKMESTSTLSGLSGTVRLNLQDIIDNLEMLMYGRVELWKDEKWGLSYDTVYMNLGYGGGISLNQSAKKEIGGDRLNRQFEVDVNADVALDIDLRLWLNDFAAHYRLVDERFGEGNQQRFIFEPYGGLRYTYLRQEATIEQSTNVRLSSSGSRSRSRSSSRSRSGKEKIGDSQDWVEPFVGGRISWDLNEKLALWFRGDIGGFGIGSASDLFYNLIPGCSYRLNDNVTFDFSYRYTKMDYSNGSGTDKLAMDLEAYGPVFGMTILF